MKTGKLILRFVLTLGAAFFLLTTLLWNAPGRDLDGSLWGQTTAAADSVRWKTYGEFSSWYAEQLFRGHSGDSQQFNAPVNDLISERASVTLGVAVRGFAAAWAATLLAGVVSHFWPAAGRTALAIGSILLSLPAAFIVLGLVLAGAKPWLGLAVCLWPKTYSYWETLLQMARKRTHVLNLMAQGAGPWRLQAQAIWRPALRQLLGLLAVSVPLVFGALIPVEVLCDQPGLGHLAWRAVTGRDLPLLTALTLLFTAATCAMSLAAELLRPEEA